MKKRLWSALLCASMLATMLPTAWADDIPADESSPVQVQDTAEASNSLTAAEAAVAQVGDQTYATLQAAINAAKDGDTVKLLENTAEDIVISGKTITLDLNGKTLTNVKVKSHTIRIAKGAGLTITGTGTVDNVTHGGGAIFNEGTVTLNGGTYTRSKEAGTFDPDQSNGNSWYTIENRDGIMTINDGVTVENAGGFSSMVHNGDQATTKPQLIINGGNFSGGKNAVKNGDNGVLEINGGTFANDEQYVIMNWNRATINGGTFTANKTSSAVLFNSSYGTAGDDVGEMTITGGTFKRSDSQEMICNAWDEDNVGHTSITGGTFSADPSAYVAPGYAAVEKYRNEWNIVEAVAQVGDHYYAKTSDATSAAKNGDTVKLLKDIDMSGNFQVNGKTLTLDMNGHKLYNTNTLWSNSGWVIRYSLVSVIGGGNLTITGNGTVQAMKNDCFAVDVQGGSTLTIENGTFAGNRVAVYVQQGTANIKGGTYSVQQKYPQAGKEDEFVLNLLDENRMNDTAKMIVTGGTFVKFDPANNKAEGEGTNFCADGYTTIKSDDNYVVKATNAKNITDLDEAIAVIENNSAKPADVKQAASVIENMDNADLAGNADAMNKLADLDKNLTNAAEGTNAKVNVSAASTVEGIDTAEVKVTNAALSADLTSNNVQNVVVSIREADNIDGTAVTNAKEQVANASGNVQKLNITMTVNDAEVKDPTAPVVLEFPLPNGWKGCQIVCVDDPDHPELIPTTVVNGMVKATFNHFSDYVSVQTNVITSPNKYRINLKPQGGKTSVYAGDTITFNVELEQTDGDFTDKIGQFSFQPESDMLEVTNITASDPFKKTGNAITAPASTDGIALGTDHKLIIGTITYKVKANSTQHTMLQVTADSESSVSAVGGKYTIGSGLTVADTNVYYDIIHVYFTNYNSNGATSPTTYYTSAGSKELYASLDDLAGREEAKAAPRPVDGSTTNGTQYRLADDAAGNELNNWVAAADGTTKYVDLVADNGTGFTEDINFQVDRVELLKIDPLPAGVEITSKTTVRDGATYVDKNADFTFTAPAAPAGEKNDVTVTVGNDTNKVDAAESDVADNPSKKQYTVDQDEMSASPVKITVNHVIDLDADDIKTFDDGAGKYLQYSKYSGSDTLVLIKGTAGVKYTLTGTDAPEIFELPDAASGTDRGYGDGFNLAVLIPRPTTGTANAETMLAYLKNTYGIAVETGTNTKLNAYDFDTNGVNSFKNDDVQATYDFSALDNIAWHPTDDLLLKADVQTYTDAAGNYNTARDGQVTTADVDAFLYNYRYTPADRPTDTNP